MDRTQRLALLLAAAVIAVLAIVLVPGTDEESDEPPGSVSPPAQTAATETAPPATTPTQPQAPREPAPPLLRAGSERELRVDEGDTVRFRVRHDAAEEVHVHGYDITRDLQPNRTATISFKADIPGIFEIELEHSGTPIGSLRVEP